MKNLLLVGIVIVVLACTSGSSSEVKVYICDNKKTEVYHLDKDCRALKKCSHEIKEVSKSVAVNKLRKRLCGYED